jgi:hypothetical protein
LEGNYEGKRSLRKPNREREDIIKNGIKETGWEGVYLDAFGLR